MTFDELNKNIDSNMDWFLKKVNDGTSTPHDMAKLCGLGDQYLKGERLNEMKNTKQRAREILNEEFGYDLEEDLKGLVNPQQMTNPRTGEKHPQFTINPNDERSRSHKDTYKKHGAKWFNGWNFTAWDDDVKKILNDKIKPTLEEIAKMDGEDPTQIADILVFLEEEMNKIISGERENTTVNLPNMHLSKKSAEDIKTRIRDLEDKLVNMTSQEEFKDFMRPILAFRNTAKQKFSFGNMIMIWIQDPEATFVQSRGNWAKKWNRNVKSDAKMISLYVPLISKDKREKEAEETPTDSDEPGPRYYTETKFIMRNVFCDIRFTEPIEGKEDKLADYEQGQKNLRNLKWNDDGTIDEDLEVLANAVEQVCKDEGIDVKKVAKDTMGGALGSSSMGGKLIKLLDGVEISEGFVKTAIHELTHSLCHWEGSRFNMKDTYSKQEQEAELCAWCVLCVFGYESTTEASVNYIGGWGLTAETARKVFKNMSQVINYIVNKIQDKIEEINSKDDSQEVK